MPFRSVLATVLRFLPVAALALLVASACGTDSGHGDAEPACLAEPADASCTNVLYGLHDGKIAPTFDEIFTRTLLPTCGVSECHAAPSPKAGLELDDADK